ncbi:MAG: DUF4112 domain-containing protein [Acidobacteriota bacterium]
MFLAALAAAVAIFAAMGVAVYAAARWLFLRAAERMSRDLDRALSRVGTGGLTRLQAFAAARGIPAAELDRQYRRSIERLTWLTEHLVRLPLVGPVGLDVLMGLIPFAGDAATTGLSLLLVARAVQFGAPPALVSRMLANVLTDFVIGAVPIAGDLADIWFRANSRNAALLRGYLDGTAGRPS